MKKRIAAALAAALLMGLLPLQALALDTEETQASLIETVKQEASNSYYRSRRTAGVSSFHGKCGMMVGHQLYNLGINTKLRSFNGNDHYDYYEGRKVTSGGYYIQTYSSEQYTLGQALQALSHNGTWNVRNVLVGFQWTKTEAGRKYGHAMFINGIIDGQVYFVESFDCPLGGAEGQVIRCSIKEFAKYFDRWTQFEGLVHFGTGNYHDVCPHVTTDLLVQTRFSATLRSEPAVVGDQGCVRLRSVAAGERLHATAIYQAEDALYYRVDTTEGYAFIPASAVSVLQISTEGLQLQDFAMSSYLTPGTVPVLKGTVTDSYGSNCCVEVSITDSRGSAVRQGQTEQLPAASLKKLTEQLTFDLLELGEYQVDIYAGRSTPMVRGGSIAETYVRTQVYRGQLQVGGDPRQVVLPRLITQPERDGWFWAQGTWYCYENGEPRTGWVDHLGVRYYLQIDGSVTTGAQRIEGKSLYFSAGGALITGWLTLEGSTSYRLEDGTAVTGWKKIDGKHYYFDDNGVMLTEEAQNG